MLTAIQNSTQQKVEASSVNKSDGPFSCLCCGTLLVIKKGRIVIHHFSHKPPVTCEYGKGETALHRRAKKEIAEALRQRGISSVEIEKRLGPVIADVYFENSTGNKIAVEVQISKLTHTQIHERTEAYAKLGIAVLWLIPWHAKLNETRYAPRQYEKWLHALNYGRVYYWERDLRIVGVHFDEHLLYKEATIYGGGYHHKSIRYRTPQKANRPLDLVLDFASTRSHSRSSADFWLPASITMRDQERAWW